MSLLTLVLLVVSQLTNEVDRPRTPPVYEVRLSVREKAVGQLNGQGEILAEPMVRVVAGREAEVRIGETIHLDGREIPYGTLVRVKIDPDRQDQVKVTGMIELSKIGPETEGIVARESKAIHFVKTLACEKKASIGITKNSEINRWVELRVDHADN